MGSLPSISPPTTTRSTVRRADDRQIRHRTLARPLAPWLRPRYRYALGLFSSGILPRPTDPMKDCS
jgi:hypothetical protein